MIVILLLSIVVISSTFGRVCIVGDAAFVPRPHTAASASKAASNAMALANSIVTYNGDVIVLTR
jgi:2-polyprenyl-6-methoxyphenol hydroxylase-like FAD-dependent oxidoreductase